jgi:hypothetical protein
MGFKKFIVIKENKKLDTFIANAELKNKLIKEYVQDNKGFDGIEEALGIKFSLPISSIPIQKGN